MRRIASRARHMSARTRIVSAIAAVAVVAGLMGAFAVAALRSTTNEFVEQVDAAQDAALEAAELRNAFQLQHQEWKSILIRGADAPTFIAGLAAVQTATEEIAAEMAELKAALARLGGSDADGGALLASFESSYAVYTTSYAQALQTLMGPHGFDPGAADAVMNGKDRPVLGALNSLADTLADNADERAERAAASAHRSLSVAVLAVVGTLSAAITGLWLVRNYGRELETESRLASVVNRFTEVTSFAADDTAIAVSNLEALALLSQPDGAVVHVLNRSKNRALVQAALGETPAEVITLNELTHCAGVVRGTLHVTDDVRAPLSVHCPVYRVSEGTVACLPLNSGEWVGTVHLHWSRPNALPLGLRASMVRVAEHAGLAIGNRRLMVTLQRQANTDARTGLANTRAFDEALDRVLDVRKPGEMVGVLMLDLDHFKDFNDRHGHAAGDEALRAFAGLLESCLREDDLAARYGGEEFAVLLPGVDVAEAIAIAERIRMQTELAVVALGPGITARITVSVGIAIAPVHATGRLALLRLADEALYRAKEAGRNRVSLIGDEDGQPMPAMIRDEDIQAAA